MTWNQTFMWIVTEGNNHFLFLKLISTDMVSMLRVEPLFRNLDGISSWKYNKSTPPFEFLSNLYEVQNPLNLNWVEENESSSLVSEICNIPSNVSNLLLIELIFKWPTVIFSRHWIFISLSQIFASRISLCLVLSTEFGIMLLWVMKVLSSQCEDSLLS